MNKECKVFACVNQKGGCTKSTSTFVLGYALAKKGLKVLLVDLDAQSNLTTMASVDVTTLDCTIADVLISYNEKKRVPIEECILQINDNLFLAPAIIDLSATDTFLMNSLSREYILKKALTSVSYVFDIIIIDCQPSLGLLPINALACATDVLIPCSTEYLSYRGLELLDDTIKMVKENLNEDLNVYGVIATKYENTIHSKEILTQLEQNYNVIGVVPKSVKVSDALYSQSGSVTEYAPESKPAKAYNKIADMIYADYIKFRENLKNENK